MRKNIYFWVFVTLQFLCFKKAVDGLVCAPRDYGEGSVVCVCNATYCDSLDVLPALNSRTAYVIESNKQGARFNSTILNFQPQASSSAETVQIQVDRSQKFQDMIGFGGAFTDSAGINFMSLPEAMRFDIVHSYYSINGSEYNIGRVPMASCDFSTWAYSYNELEDDFEQENFQLAPEDMLYKIPFLLKAKSISTQPLLLFGSPWAPPAWMKTNNLMQHNGVLKGEPGGQYYQSWANYFVKFLQAYESSNLTFWGLTAENEPSAGYVPNYSWQCLGFTPETQRTFIAENLGPTLKKAGFGVDKIKLMIMDDQRVFLPAWAKRVLANQNVSDYVSGIAFHWYMNFMSPASLLDKTHDEFPDKFILATEACEGYLPWQWKKVSLGDWGRAESYAHDIIQDILHWTSGWTDWNLALDLEGGPNWVKNFVDSPIIVNATSGEFYKQPMYYALAHFSKFVKSGSSRIGSSISSNKLEQVAFQTPNRSTALIVLNRNSKPYNLEIREANSSLSIQKVISANSIQTYIWTDGSDSELTF